MLFLYIENPLKNTNYEDDSIRVLYVMVFLAFISKTDHIFTWIQGECICVRDLPSFV